MIFSRNSRYFKYINLKTPIFLIIIGILFLIISKVIGITVAVIGVLLMYMQYAIRPPDSEIDEIRAKEVANARQKALSKMSLDEDTVRVIEPILIEGPCYENITTPFLYRQGRDGCWRSSNYEAIVLFFSEKQIYSYIYRFSIINDEKKESTDEYFYKDIVSVATSTDNVTLKKKSGKVATVSYQKFKLTTLGGNSITCSLWDYGSLEKSIQEMKQLIREKKNA